MTYVFVDVTFKHLSSEDLPGPLLQAGLIVSELFVGKYPIQFAENNPVLVFLKVSASLQFNKFKSC